MTDELPTIYKRTTTGAIQEWRQEFNYKGDGYRTISGQKGGRMVESEWTICTPKNVGRSNATTAAEQAELEVEANYVHKLERGYVMDEADVDDTKLIPFKPMLAKKYEDYPITDWSNVYSQPKLDGVRANVFHDAMLSRQGKPLISCPHIVEALGPAFQRLGTDAIFDGELYAHKLRDDFNKIISLAKKGKPTKQDIAESESMVEYWLYDLPSVEGGFAERSRVLHSLKDILPPCIVIVPTVKVDSQDILDALYAEYMEEGMEGQMVRFDGDDYENKRTKNLLKRKEFMDEEFMIIDIEEGVGNRSGMAGKILYKTKAGKEFRSGIKGDFAYFKKLLAEKDRFIGCEATVTFFNYTPDGIPRFPVTKVIHETDRI